MIYHPLACLETPSYNLLSITHFGLAVCCAASEGYVSSSPLRNLCRDGLKSVLPLLVASSNSAVSTPFAGRCTYLTTLPLMKTFLTALCLPSVSHCPIPCSLPEIFYRLPQPYAFSAKFNILAFSQLFSFFLGSNPSRAFAWTTYQMRILQLLHNLDVI